MIKTLTQLAILSSSWDILGMINIGGFNFRFTQFIVLPVLSYLMINVLFRPKKVKLVYGWGGLLLWTLIQGVFIVRSPSLKNALGYYMWLVFNVSIIFAVALCTDRFYDFKWLVKTYMNSFYFMAIIGLLQFFLYFFGINFFAAQHGTNWTRINGFCYEPSYYSTYMLMGFVMFSYLKLKGDTTIFSMSELNTRFYTTTLVLFLCSSRLGWGLMVLWFMMTIKLAKGVKRLRMILAVATILFLAVSFLLFIQSIYHNDFLSGLGIGGRSAHSSNDRFNGYLACIRVFSNSPWIGYSLGGVDPILAQYAGRTYSTLNNGAAMSVVGELLVASGITGIIPLIYYIYALFKHHFKHNNIYSAIIYSLGIEMLALVFCQNILRPYFWWHIAILCAAYKHFKSGQPSELDASRHWIVRKPRVEIHGA